MWLYWGGRTKTASFLKGCGDILVLQINNVYCVCARGGTSIIKQKSQWTYRESITRKNTAFYSLKSAFMTHPGILPKSPFQLTCWQWFQESLNKKWIKIWIASVKRCKTKQDNQEIFCRFSVFQGQESFINCL